MRTFALVVVLLVWPLQLQAQEAPECFEIEFTERRPTGVSDLEGDTLTLTDTPYSRDREGDVVWREAALSGGPRWNDTRRPLVWRGLPGDSIEVLPPQELGRWALRAERSDGMLSGFLQWISHLPGPRSAEPSYYFRGRCVPCTD